MQGSGIFFPSAMVVLQCLLVGLGLAKTTINITTDQSSLVALKSHIFLPPHHVLWNNWSIATSPVCDWIGVTCSPIHQRVTALNISNMGLGGIIPPHLGNLSFLVSLDMSNNTFQGNLPQELGHLRRLKYIDFRFNALSGGFPSWTTVLPKLEYLLLANNSFTGTIPPSISNMSKLQKLNLHYNSFQGRIPQDIHKLLNLKDLNLQYNQLTGPLPFTIFNMSSLQSIALTQNGLSGSLPEDMCLQLPRIQALYLSLNQFYGSIPSSINECSELQILSLSYNKLSGHIPRQIGNLTMLMVLYLGGNNMRGEIPEEIGNLLQLEVLGLESNRFSGSIPPTIFNISSLTFLELAVNNLSGSLTSSIGQSLHNLEILNLAMNGLGGTIPDTISNASQVATLDISNNKFTGSLPNSLGNMVFLQFLNMAKNNFISAELGFWTSLENCKVLEILDIHDNPINGTLPSSIGNLSSSFQSFYGYRCKLEGNIPSEIGNLSNLVFLSLFGNDLSGFIPTSIRKLEKLQGLDLEDNRIQGSIPNDICYLSYLGSLRLQNNQIGGSVPACLGNVTSLRYLFLASNKLTSTIPRGLWSLKYLLNLDLSSNSLSGSLPLEIGKLEVATLIDLSKNLFSGSVPGTIGDLLNLNLLSFAENRLQGHIPESFGHMLSLETLDLSHNNISGVIPKSLEALSYLKFFNVSYNKLVGEIPHGGPFAKFQSQSYISNEALCGDPRLLVPPCHTISHQNSKTKKVLLLVFMLLAIAIIFSILTIVFLLRQRRKKVPTQVDLLPKINHERISFYDLQRATEGFSENNLLGKGNFGSVYKGVLTDGSFFAIKVFNLEVEGSFKSFDTECEVLRNLRHRNLTKVVSSCSNLDFKALVLQYMSNGSLERWLYSDSILLNILQCLNIMIDVACALEYLHHGYHIPVAHCDLKPSNILLDEDMVAHVSDFGISKLLGWEQSIAQTMTLATLGYMAPEYGLEGLVSTRCDVYSFGIILMETFTRKRPTDEKFTGNLSLKGWVKESLPNGVFEIIDANLIKLGEEHLKMKSDCITSIMELALNCTADLPEERINIKDTVVALKRIRSQFLPYHQAP